MSHPYDDRQRPVNPLSWFESGRQLFLRNPLPAIALPFAVVGPLVLLGAAALAGTLAIELLADRVTGRLNELLTAAALEGYLGVLAVLFIAVMPALLAGVFACFLQGVRTGRLTADRLLDGFRSWWACTWVVWLLESAVGLSIPLIVVLIGAPCIYALHTLIWLALFRIVDKRQGGGQAILFAWRVMQERWLMLTFFTFVMMTVVMAGTLVLIGMILITPIATAALAAGYDALSQNETDNGRAALDTKP
jgi:hypothetical protein